LEAITVTRLEDTPRKVLNILYSLYRQNWVRPDIAHIARIAVRSEDRVRDAIKMLRAAGFVEIVNGKMRIVRAVEDEPKPQKSDIRIWLDY
jgi:SOS-response transcriptional repressor LexA